MHETIFQPRGKSSERFKNSLALSYKKGHKGKGITLI